MVFVSSGSAFGVQSRRGTVPLGLPSLGYHVRNVIQPSPKEQMVWVDARRIVTSVQNPKIVMDRASEEKIRNAMRPHILSVGVKRAVSLDLTPDPFPTLIRRANGDLRHEPLEKLRVRARKRGRCYDGISHDRSSNQGLVVRPGLSVRALGRTALDFNTIGESW
jgi:hypothetical protein